MFQMFNVQCSTSKIILLNLEHKFEHHFFSLEWQFKLILVFFFYKITIYVARKYLMNISEVFFFEMKKKNNLNTNKLNVSCKKGNETNYNWIGGEVWRNFWSLKIIIFFWFEFKDVYKNVEWFEMWALILMIQISKVQNENHHLLTA